MPKIFKYQFDASIKAIVMPQESKILALQVQHGTTCIWAQVNPEMPPISRKIKVVGTGHEFDPAGYSYIDSFQLFDGSLVFHFFIEDEV